MVYGFVGSLTSTVRSRDQLLILRHCLLIGRLMQYDWSTPAARRRAESSNISVACPRQRPRRKPDTLYSVPSTPRASFSLDFRVLPGWHIMHLHNEKLSWRTNYYYTGIIQAKINVQHNYIIPGNLSRKNHTVSKTTPPTFTIPGTARFFLGDQTRHTGLQTPKYRVRLNQRK